MNTDFLFLLHLHATLRCSRLIQSTCSVSDWCIRCTIVVQVQEILVKNEYLVMLFIKEVIISRQTWIKIIFQNNNSWWSDNWAINTHTIIIRWVDIFCIFSSSENISIMKLSSWKNSAVNHSCFQKSIAYNQSFYALMFHLPIQKNSWLAACSDWSCNLVFSPIPFILFEMKILCTSIISIIFALYETNKNFTIFHKLFQSCSLINGVSMGVKYRWKPLNRYKEQWTLWLSSYILLGKNYNNLSSV